MAPALRALPELGVPHDDPSEDLLFMLLEDIDSGEGSFLIVERTSDPTGQTYAQTQRQADGSYVLEHREGDAEHHFATTISNMRTAHQLLTGWAFELPGWSETVTWASVTS